MSGPPAPTPPGRLGWPQQLSRGRSAWSLREPVWWVERSEQGKEKRHGAEPWHSRFPGRLRADGEPVHWSSRRIAQVVRSKEASRLLMHFLLEAAQCSAASAHSLRLAEHNWAAWATICSTRR